MENGQDQNDAQGDSVSFKINYTLIEITSSKPPSSGSGGSGSHTSTPSASPTPTSFSGITLFLRGLSGSQYLMPSLRAGLPVTEWLSCTLEAASPDGRISLSINAGTLLRVSTENGLYPLDLSTSAILFPI